MKKVFFLMMLLCATIAYSQSYEIVQSGLCNSEDPEKAFLVLEVNEKTAQDLYSNSIKYINETYKNPDEVIKVKTENEYLRFDTYVSGFGTVKNSGVKLVTNAKYTIELKFKDGKVRFEITQLDITADNGGLPVTFTGSVWKGYPIYNKKGAVRLPETKQQIESYFNSKISDLLEYLKGEKSSDDNW